MSKKTWSISIVAVAVSIAAFFAVLPLARAQMQVAAATHNPIGVAASGTNSTAWFHQPATGTVIACQTAAGAGGAVSGIHCVAAKLP